MKSNLIQFYNESYLMFLPLEGSSRGKLFVVFCICAVSILRAGALCLVTCPCPVSATQQSLSTYTFSEHGSVWIPKCKHRTADWRVRQQNGYSSAQFLPRMILYRLIFLCIKCFLTYKIDIVYAFSKTVAIPVLQNFVTVGPQVLSGTVLSSEPIQDPALGNDCSLMKGVTQ